MMKASQFYQSLDFISLQKGHHVVIREKGFSLMELLVALAIIAIIAAIAVPSYLHQSRMVKRADGIALLSEMAQFQERFFLENNTYTQDLNDLGYTGGGTWYESEDGKYKARVQTTANCGIANCYRLFAQTNHASQTDDGHLRLWSDGRKQRKVSGAWKNGWK